jgi:hypothetical protein
MMGGRRSVDSRLCEVFLTELQELSATRIAKTPETKKCREDVENFISNGEMRYKKSLFNCKNSKKTLTLYVCTYGCNP